jgi:hypothetical protein
MVATEMLHKKVAVIEGFVAFWAFKFQSFFIALRL